MELPIQGSFDQERRVFWKDHMVLDPVKHFFNLLPLSPHSYVSTPPYGYTDLGNVLVERAIGTQAAGKHESAAKGGVRRDKREGMT